MNVKSLTLKNRLIIDKSGEGYWDLTAPSFIYESDLGVKALHYVMLDQIGRIDKISEIYFGSGEYIDAICVVNNIFNPFSVNEGDILIIPNLSRKDLVYKRPNPASRPNAVQEAYVDTWLLWAIAPTLKFVDESLRTPWRPSAPLTCWSIMPVQQAPSIR